MLRNLFFKMTLITVGLWLGAAAVSSAQITAGFILNFDAQDPASGVSSTSWVSTTPDGSQDFGFGADVSLVTVSSALTGINKAYRFTGGIGDDNNATWNGLYGEGNATTWEFWLKPSDTGDAGQVIYESGGSGTGYAIWYAPGTTGDGSGTLNFTADGGGGAQIETVKAVIDCSEFRQITCIYEKDTGGGSIDLLAIYVDGVFVDDNLSATTGDDVSNDNDNTDISDYCGGDGTGLGNANNSLANGATDGEFDGDISIFRVWGGITLTASEVLNNYNELAGPDTAPPTIDALDPADDATEVFPGTDLVATFSEDVMIVTNGTISIVNTNAGTQVDITLPDPQVSVAGPVLTINPTSDLGSGTNYAVQISSDAIADLATNNFAGITNNTTWNFITATPDLTAPLITNTVPADEEIGVVPTVALVAEFDDDIVAGSGDIVIVDTTDGSSTQTIPVTNAAQVSIVDNVLTITPSVALEGATVYAVQIAAGAVENFSGVGFAGISDITTWNFTVTDVTVYTGPDSNGKSDTWNVTGNWSAGIPAGALNAVIPSSITVTVDDGSLPTYYGDLSIGTNSTLRIEWTGSEPALYNALGTTGQTVITTADGVLINCRAGNATIDVPEIQLQGDLTIIHSQSTQPSVTMSYGDGVFGPHTIILQGKGGSQALLSVSNSFAALEISEQASGHTGMEVHANAEGSLSGNVSLKAKTDGTKSGSLIINATNAMVDTVVLDLNGLISGSLITMNADDTADTLVVNGVTMPSGTYGRVGTPAAVDYEVDWVDGDGALTAINPAADTTAPVLVNITNAPASGIHYYVNAPVTYTLTFDEAVTSAVTVADFENTGTAPVSIDSVTQSDVNEFTVVVTPSAAGTLILRILASASFSDLPGNTLTGPITDSATVDVVDLPPDSLIYEPFDYATGNLSGKNGGSGFAGAWVNTKNQPLVDPESKYWGSLLTVGNHARGAAWSGVTRSIGTTLTDAGLMANGATLWFALIMDLEGQNLTNADLNMALGTDGFHPSTFGDRENLIAGEGIGVGHRNDIKGAYWQDTDADTVAERTDANSSRRLQDGTRALVVGKIEWGATDLDGETLTLYAPDTDLDMGTPILDSWTTAPLDQSQFNLLAIQFKDQSRIDEIRFGASYEEVVGLGAAPSSAGTMIMIR